MSDNSAIEAENLDRQLAAMTDLVTPWAVRVFVSLGLPEQMGEEETELSELAESTNCNLDALGTLLDYLVEHSVVSRRSVASPESESSGMQVCFGLTPLGQRLAPASARSQRGGPNWSARLDLDGSLTRIDHAHSAMIDSMRSGGAAYPSVFGRPFWDDLAQNPALSQSFDLQLQGWASRWAPAVARLDLWSKYSTITDVAGGTGSLTAELLRAHPGLHSTVVELEASADRAIPRLQEWIAADRCRVVVGDMFSEVSTGSNAYVLAQVLHDWNDESASAILAQCAAAAGLHGDVVVVERLLVPAHASEPQSNAEMNLMMLVLFGARERTLAQYEQLAGEVGLKLSEATPSEYGLWTLRFAQSSSPTSIEAND